MEVSPSSSANASRREKPRTSRTKRASATAADPATDESEKTRSHENHWGVIQRMISADESYVCRHHLQTYNYFVEKQIYDVFRNNNPVYFYKERLNNRHTDENAYRFQAKLHLGGKDGSRVYFGKPIIYDREYQHYMHPNEARLRDMTYGANVYFDIDLECTETSAQGETRSVERTLKFVHMCKLPVMLRSTVCSLAGLNTQTRFDLGECRNDPGGYFVIDGSEKVLISQEKFANNTINVSAKKEGEPYSHVCSVVSISEDPSKPRHRLDVRMVRPSLKYMNGQITVEVPMIQKAVPLFVLMRALGLASDREIIETCLMDMEKNAELVDDFAPSIHDAGPIYTREVALKFLATFTKFKKVPAVLFILSNHFLPHMGTMNFKAKARYLGHMVYRLIRVYRGIDEPTDRDSFKYKRIQTPGSLLATLFSDYYRLQLGSVKTMIDREYNSNPTRYKQDLEAFTALFEEKYKDFFVERIVDEGIARGFKGNWGAHAHTRITGVAQPLDRRSYNSMISQMRKTNLDLDKTAKVVQPRLLHPSQWGFVCPVDTPDGENVGLHKYLTVGACVSPHVSARDIHNWLRENCVLTPLHDCHPREMYHHMKAFVNGVLVGVMKSDVREFVRTVRMHRRAGIVPVYLSVDVDYTRREVYVNGDEGRVMRPVYHVDEEEGIPSFEKRPAFWASIVKARARGGGRGRGDVDWPQILTGMNTKRVEGYHHENTRFYKPAELYGEVEEAALVEYGGLVELLDCGESDSCYVAMERDHIGPATRHTHLEVHPSLVLSVLSNQTNFAEHNFAVRDYYSPGQIRQTMSVFHTNFGSRIDSGYLLHYGQHPIARTRYYEMLTKNEHPYGENLIVAIMSYTGYNVEDSLIFNEGSIRRGTLGITYYTSEKAEEFVSGASTVGDDGAPRRSKSSSQSDVRFRNVPDLGEVDKIKPGYDYSHLDENGIIKENTPIDDKTVLVGRVFVNKLNHGTYIDDSVTTHKEQQGFVDKVFMCEKGGGARMVKLRVREHREPRIGDKFVSRCAQKGTIGRILPEADMPFTAEGVRPDVIINPHCMPSRMTVGQLIETLVSKACVYHGCQTDCTAFDTGADKHVRFGKLLNRVGTGMHSAGLETFYDGFTGEQIEAEVYCGPTYYMRLKQMTQDKINYRARGKREILTRQTVQGRSHDGGLRVGEMERDGLIAHGATHFLTESMMVRGDGHEMPVCNKTGSIAAYNASRGIRLSPALDGPLQFSYNTNNTEVHLDHVSQNHHSFSTVRIPYSLKLMMQELATMNIDMRLITEATMRDVEALGFTERYREERDKEAGQKVGNGIEGDGIEGDGIEGDETETVVTADRIPPPPAPEGMVDVTDEIEPETQEEPIRLQPMADDDEEGDEEDDEGDKEDGAKKGGTYANGWAMVGGSPGVWRSLLDSSETVAAASPHEVAPASFPKGWDANVIDEAAKLHGVEPAQMATQITDALKETNLEGSDAPLSDIFHTAVRTVMNSQTGPAAHGA